MKDVNKLIDLTEREQREFIFCIVEAMRKDDTVFKKVKETVLPVAEKIIDNTNFFVKCRK